MVLKCLCFGDWKKGNASCSSKKQYPTVIEELCHPFSFHDLRKSTNNFDQKLIIGERALNKVYKGYLNHNNNNNGAAATDYTVALKVMTVPLEFKKEVEMLCQLHHPNIISLIGFCHHGKEKIAVYEYTDNGTLHDYLNNKDKEPLSWKKRLDICIGVARALHYLHSGVKRAVFHRDISPINILLDRNMMPKLANFVISLQGGLSTLKPKQIKVDKIVGTSALMAPEYAIHGIVTDKCDVYSFGLVLLHMVGHIVLNYLIQHEEHILEETLDPILRGKIAPECWQVFTSVIQSCLEYEADERPTMGEVEVLLEHALSLQQQADIIRNAACYTLSSTTPCYCRQRYNNHESLPR
ncbi:receptor-like protein kinase FERONIA isoform X1 [Arachis duranensis]|uniref:Receptor-like protein kinase FERONIA isoform X1 n=1 Tax=Arachis duranensis TaxID=130453 RepID=A0A6P4D7N0_ARADU|nr:receptor-like protein kinase FERONIA isoform X1 [Arachis duranensis]XP_015962635.1 receptor-like protein kinase FERONIA isoform X1 [Arachis duranensis]